MPDYQAFAVWHKDYPHEERRVYETTASRARHDYFLDIRDPFPDARYIDIRSRKLPGPTVSRHRICKECDYGYPINSHQDPSAQHDVCNDWNAKYPEGTRVGYFEVMGMGEELITETRSIAWLVGGQPVVMIEGKAGGCALDHMRLLV